MNVCGLKGQNHSLVWAPCGVSCPDIQYMCVSCVCVEAEEIAFVCGSFMVFKDTSES